MPPLSPVQLSYQQSAASTQSVDRPYLHPRKALNTDILMVADQPDLYDTTHSLSKTMLPPVAPLSVKETGALLLRPLRTLSWIRHLDAGLFPNAEKRQQIAMLLRLSQALDPVSRKEIAALLKKKEKGLLQSAPNSGNAQTPLSFLYSMLKSPNIQPELAPYRLSYLKSAIDMLAAPEAMGQRAASLQPGIKATLARIAGVQTEEEAEQLDFKNTGHCSTLSMGVIMAKSNPQKLSKILYEFMNGPYARTEVSPSNVSGKELLSYRIQPSHRNPLTGKLVIPLQSPTGTLARVVNAASQYDENRFSDELSPAAIMFTHGVADLVTGGRYNAILDEYPQPYDVLSVETPSLTEEERNILMASAANGDLSIPEVIDETEKQIQSLGNKLTPQETQALRKSLHGTTKGLNDPAKLMMMKLLMDNRYENINYQVMQSGKQSSELYLLGYRSSFQEMSQDLKDALDTAGHPLLIGCTFSHKQGGKDFDGTLDNNPDGLLRIGHEFCVVDYKTGPDGKTYFGLSNTDDAIFNPDGSVTGVENIPKIEYWSEDELMPHLNEVVGSQAWRQKIEERLSKQGNQVYTPGPADPLGRPPQATSKNPELWNAYWESMGQPLTQQNSNGLPTLAVASNLVAFPVKNPVLQIKVPPQLQTAAGFTPTPLGSTSGDMLPR